MKRIFSILLAAALFAALLLPVSADVLWEPIDNDYYRNHGYETFTNISRTYYVPEGMTVNFYTSPEGGKLVKTLDAGTRIYVGYSTTVSDEVWGVGYPLGDWNTEGWFRLGRLQLEYDSNAFFMDHADEIQSVVGSIPCSSLTGPVPTWTYPGSGISETLLDLDWSQVTYNEGNLTYFNLYTDPNGDDWGYVGYYMGSCGWIYLPDLHSETPPAFPHIPENTVTDTSPVEDATAPSGALLWVILPVAALVILTAICIVMMKRKKKGV